MADAPTADAGPNRGYVFVPNVRELIGTDSMILVPGHVLRRASPVEMDQIRANIRFATPRLALSRFWEFREIADRRLERLPQAEWRYFVVAFEGTNQVMLDLTLVFHLAPLELRVGFEIMEYPSMGAVGLGLHPERAYQALNLMDPDFVSVTAEDGRGIRELHDKLSHHDPGLVDVKRFATELQSLDAIPRESPLLFLGYFAVLEALLTHSPSPKDPYDSITRQVKGKVALLGHRCQPAIDYAEFGGASAAETVWETMYTYRSRLAHGDPVDFARGLRRLASRDSALRLLKTSVKALLRQALIGPQLVADLKNC